MNTEIPYRLKLAIPKFSDSRSNRPLAELLLVADSEFDPSLEFSHDIFSIDGKGFDSNKQIFWDVMRVRSNRSRKEMNRGIKSDQDSVLYRLSYVGMNPKWQLGPGHYILKISHDEETVLCETSFVIPWPKSESDLEAFEKFLDQEKIEPGFRRFLIQHREEIRTELHEFAQSEFEDFKLENEHLQNATEIAIRKINHEIAKESKHKQENEWSSNEFLTRTIEAAKGAFKRQMQGFKALEKVFELLKTREYDDDEFEALVKLIVRGVELDEYDEFGLLKIILNNAHNLRIDKMRKENSETARIWEYEEIKRQEDGYSTSLDGVEHQLPQSPSDQFESEFKKLSPKKKRHIIPQLVLSINNLTSGGTETIDLPIDDTWMIGRQTREELNRYGPWQSPFLDFENRRIILAGYHHNTFSKNLISIIPTYKHVEYMGLGRTVSLLNPSTNYAISLGSSILLEPGASYATPSHLFFHYRISPSAIRLKSSHREKLQLTPEQEQARFLVRIEVFFDELNKGEIRKVLVANHQWIGEDASSDFDDSMLTMKPTDSSKKLVP